MFTQTSEEPAISLPSLVLPSDSKLVQRSTFFTKKTTVHHPSMRACLKKKTTEKREKRIKVKKKKNSIRSKHYLV